MSQFPIPQQNTKTEKALKMIEKIKLPVMKKQNNTIE